TTEFWLLILLLVVLVIAAYYYLKRAQARQAKTPPQEMRQEMRREPEPQMPPPTTPEMPAMSARSEDAQMAAPPRSEDAPMVASPYAPNAMPGDQAYQYSPAFAQLLTPVQLLPFEWFAVLWTVLQLAILMLLTNPVVAVLFLLVPFIGLVEELVAGNIHVLLA